VPPRAQYSMSVSIGLPARSSTSREAEPVRKLLPKIETPVLIITGDHDPGVLPVNGEYLRERLPHNKSVKLMLAISPGQTPLTNTLT
jgi:pimeloyl-ACP methyl ester carboxylesterase